MKEELLNQKGISGGLIAIIIAAFLIFAAGGYYMLIQRGDSIKSPKSENSNVSPKNAASQPKSKEDLSSTIQDIVGKGQNLECDWHMPDTGSPNPFGAGKLYTASNKGRSTISGNASGMAIDGNGIYKDNTAYSWVSVAGTTIGFKFDKDELEKMNSEMTAEQKQQAEQIRAKMIFNCKPWTPDESKFILPTGVEFK